MALLPRASRLRAHAWVLFILFQLSISPKVIFTQRVIYGGNSPVNDTRGSQSPPPPVQSAPDNENSSSSSVPAQSPIIYVRRSTSSSAIGAAVGITAATTFLICLILFCIYKKFRDSAEDVDSNPLLGFLKKSSSDTGSDPENNHNSGLRHNSRSRKSSVKIKDEGKAEIQSQSESQSQAIPEPKSQPSESDVKENRQERPNSLPPRPPPPPPRPSKGAAPPPPPPPPLSSSPFAAPQSPQSPFFRTAKPLPVPPFAPRSPADSAASSPRAGRPPTRLKPLHWDKVMANPEHSMVWHRIKSGSFRVDEEMMETLFGYDIKKEPRKNAVKSSPFVPQNRNAEALLNPRKSQNFAIMLRALNVTIDEVRDALLEGDDLNIEFLERVVKFTLTQDEEEKLKGYNGELSALGPAERFLKALLDIPFAFKRLDAMLYKATFHEEVDYISESFAVLEAACTELRGGRLFLKLLEAVLKTGNRMNAGTNRGGAQAFNLNTLLRLADVKGTDGKTTLLHFVVKEIIRSEGKRLAKSAGQPNQRSDHDMRNELSESECMRLGLQAVAGLSNELNNVKKSAGIDADIFTISISRLVSGLAKLKELLTDMSKHTVGRGKQASDGSILPEDQFCKSFEPFVKEAEEKLKYIQSGEERVISAVKRITAYYHAEATGDKSQLFNIFVIVKDFLVMLDPVCVEIAKSLKRKSPRAEEKDSPPSSFNSPLTRAFPSPFKSFYESSDDENTSE